MSHMYWESARKHGNAVKRDEQLYFRRYENSEGGPALNQTKWAGLVRQSNKPGIHRKPVTLPKLKWLED